MALPLLATVEQLEARVGDIAAADHPRVESLLRYASNLVRAYGNRQWDDGDPPEELVEVVIGMVERAQNNPTGVTQDTTGPFSVSYGSDAAQRIYLTKSDRTIIRSVTGAGSTAFTVPQRTGHAGWLGGRS